MSYRARFGTLLVALLVAASAEFSLAQTGQMQMPDNHKAADWWLKHGQSAKADISFCAVCHARDYCSGCHVNAASVPAIQALAPNPEVAAYVAEKEWPAPPTHTAFWLTGHRAQAAAATSQCEVCHVVEQFCQTCHLGSETAARPRRDVPNYHALNFLERHSAAAFNRENECASCHNPEVFCRSCHISLGRATEGRTTTGIPQRGPPLRFRPRSGRPAGIGELCIVSCSARLSGLPFGPGGPEDQPAWPGLRRGEAEIEEQAALLVLPF